MARGVPLSTLRTMLKAEIGHSLTTGQAQDEELRLLLDQKQRWLASHFDWPFLEVMYDVYLSPGERYAELPNGINYDRPVQVSVLDTAGWRRVEYGIGPCEYTLYNSDEGATALPIRRWRMVDRVVAGPSDAPEVTVVEGGSVTALYAVTFVTPWGETDASPWSEEVEAASVRVTLPLSESQYVTGRKVYRKKGATVELVATVGAMEVEVVNAVAEAGQAATLPTTNAALAPHFEVWPLGSVQQVLRFVGQRPVRSLDSESAGCDLDDVLLVLHCAADKLARLRQQDAQLKLAQAQERALRLRATAPTETYMFVMGQHQKCPRRFYGVGGAAGGSLFGLSGKQALPVGTTAGTVTFVRSFTTAPSSVRLTVSKPEGGLVMYATLVEGSLTKSGFAFELSGQVDSDGYYLHYAVSL